MPGWLHSLFEFFSAYQMRPFWYLVIGVVFGCYAFAFIVFHALPSEGVTIVARARRAWGISFLTHALCCMAVTIYWYLEYRLVAEFGSFFVCYCLLLAFDFTVGIGLIFSARRFRDYA